MWILCLRAESSGQPKRSPARRWRKGFSQREESRRTASAQSPSTAMRRWTISKSKDTARFPRSAAKFWSASSRLCACRWGHISASSGSPAPLPTSKAPLTSPPTTSKKPPPTAFSTGKRRCKGQNAVAIITGIQSSIYFENTAVCIIFALQIIMR